MTVEETIEALIWSFVATSKDRDLDEDPEVTIARTLNHWGGPSSLDPTMYRDVAEVAAECGVRWPCSDELLRAGMWAGRARWALIQRDNAIREALAGHSVSAVARMVGMTRPGVDGVSGRAGRSTNARW